MAGSGGQGRNWEAVAAELGSGRTAWQCFCEYARLQDAERRVLWSPEEDERLRELVERFGAGPWRWRGSQLVHAASPDPAPRCERQKTGRRWPCSWVRTPRRCSAACGGRSWARSGGWGRGRRGRTDACSSPTRHAATPGYAAAEALPGWWQGCAPLSLTRLGVCAAQTEVSSFLPGRTHAQCRERYTFVLSRQQRPQRQTGDAERLMALIDTHGGCCVRARAPLRHPPTDPPPCLQAWTGAPSRRAWVAPPRAVAG